MQRTKRKWNYFALLAVLSAQFTLAGEADRVRFNENWRFHAGDSPDAGNVPLNLVQRWLTQFHTPQSAASTQPSSAPATDWAFAAASFDDTSWRDQRLPHDWAIEGPFVQDLPGETGKRPFAGVAWYRKTFDLPATDNGRSVFLDFDGAMSNATVWINGQFAGGWPYGYASFRVDATRLARPGRNVVAVRLQNPANSSRWYPGAGIYRNVWLVRTSPLHVGQWGVYVTTPTVTDAQATVRTQITINNASDHPASASAVVEIFEADDSGTAVGTPVATQTLLISADAKSVPTLDVSLNVANPKRWSPDTPHRYVARVRLQQDAKTVDQYDQPFGIRTAEFTADNGFVLNGKRLPLNGVCEHHDLGALGAAFNTRAMERKLELLKSMGVNALRTSHNPPAPEVLDLCDRMGIVVIDESFDCWQAGKTRSDYGRIFKDWSEHDVRALVRRDRNHPSVIAWSIGNEVLEQGKARGATTQQGMSIGQRLTALFKEEDPTRQTTVAYDHPASGFNGMNTVVDVMGFNYKPMLYERFHKQSPNQPFIGSETSSTVSSRGEYFFPVVAEKSGGRSDFQMSSYDLYFPPWATTADTEFAAHDKVNAVAGEFVWTGFDYLGEPTPYNSDSTNLLNFSDPEEKARAEAELKAMGKIRVPSRSSYFGIIDLAGFPKDRFYLYQAHWRPDLPMAHILPHWNWPERVGQVTPVHVYTSGDEAELFLNGKSLGRKTKEPLTYRLRWDDVVYEPGELKVVTYKNGKLWAEATTRTTGPAAQLSLSPDRSTLAADGDDLSFVTLSVNDTAGRMVPRSSPRVQFKVSGPGEIVATDNGNAIDLSSFQSPDRNAYNGLALVIVRAKPGASGTITVTATADGLTTATASITAK
ncbi:MAG: beta-galactosidase GalB [Tepidisphaeraceae bacterium]